MTSPAPEASTLLAWYDTYGRELPWRLKNGESPDPYRVWISEIMLQQTTVATVIPYFQLFMKRWPTVQDLAAAPLDDVLHGWQGLGYYSRARNLHKCAKEVVEKGEGRFPTSEIDLLRLPGIGPYTAAALLTIAFNRPAIAMDGNILRVFSRVRALEMQGPALKEAVHQISARLVSAHRAGDYTQALMDLGAMICRPRQPLCPQCPWKISCRAFAQNRVMDFPRLPEKKPLPSRYGLVFWAQRQDGAVLLEQREAKGLLGGLMAFPSTAWISSRFEEEAPFPVSGKWRLLSGEVAHTFTHFKLFLTIWKGYVDLEVAEGLWVRPDSFGNYAFSTLMKKVTRHVALLSGENLRKNGQSIGCSGKTV